MCSKVNISKTSRQVVNKQISPKVSKIDQFSLNICKLKYGRTFAIGDGMYHRILRDGSFTISMKDLSKMVDLTERNTREAVNALVDFGAFKKTRGFQTFNPKYNGPSTFHLGHALFETEKLKILCEQMPTLYCFLPIVIEAQKEGWKPGQKLSTKGGVRRRVINKIRGGALRSILNNNPYCSLHLDISPKLEYEKEHTGAREKVCVTKHEIFENIPSKTLVEIPKPFLSNLPKKQTPPEQQTSYEERISRAVATLTKELSTLSTSKLEEWKIRKSKSVVGTMQHDIYAGIGFL